MVVPKPAPYRSRVVCEVRDHAPVLHGGGAVQRGLEGDPLVVDHHHPRHIPARLLVIVKQIDRFTALIFTCIRFSTSSMSTLMSTAGVLLAAMLLAL